MRIVQIKTSPDRAGRYWVTFDNGEKLALYRQTVEDFGLYTGRDLSEEEYASLQEADFCSKFSPYIGSENIEPIIELLEEALRRLRQNGDPRIVLSYFALATSRYINFGK